MVANLAEGVVQRWVPFLRAMPWRGAIAGCHLWVPWWGALVLSEVYGGQIE